MGRSRSPSRKGDDYKGKGRKRERSRSRSPKGKGKKGRSRSRSGKGKKGRKGFDSRSRSPKGKGKKGRRRSNSRSVSRKKGKGKGRSRSRSRKGKGKRGASRSRSRKGKGGKKGRKGDSLSRSPKGKGRRGRKGDSRSRSRRGNGKYRSRSKRSRTPRKKGGVNSARLPSPPLFILENSEQPPPNMEEIMARLPLGVADKIRDIQGPDENDCLFFDGDVLNRIVDFPEYTATSLLDQFRTALMAEDLKDPKALLNTMITDKLAVDMELANSVGIKAMIREVQFVSGGILDDECIQTLTMIDPKLADMTLKNVLSTEKVRSGNVHCISKFTMALVKISQDQWNRRASKDSVFYRINRLINLDVLKDGELDEVSMDAVEHADPEHILGAFDEMLALHIMGRPATSTNNRFLTCLGTREKKAGVRRENLGNRHKREERNHKMDEAYRRKESQERELREGRDRHRQHLIDKYKNRTNIVDIRDAGANNTASFDVRDVMPPRRDTWDTGPRRDNDNGNMRRPDNHRPDDDEEWDTRYQYTQQVTDVAQRHRDLSTWAD